MDGRIRQAPVATVCAAIDEIDAREWNSLAGASNPFLRHEFLGALEHRGCVGESCGWEPSHLILRDASGRLTGAMPLYLKHHSWGEFVFDWSWARAYEELGLPYYPKLVSAVPFTPVQGPRMLVDPEAAGPARQALLDGAVALAERLGVSSLHVLFPEADEHHALEQAGLLLRKDCQFHWRNAGYRSFEDFLARFSSAKRRKVRRERSRVTAAGIRFQTLPGSEVAARAWDDAYRFCADTFLRRGHRPYLSRSFFDEICTTMGEQVVLTLALRDDAPVAVAICLRGVDTLYGRYWGSAEDYHSLHFETCYYQGIEYCIREGLQRFEPGAQGEYKIRRGFEPVGTWSGHWLAHPQFATAVADYLARERTYVDDYMAEARSHLPFRRDPDNPPADP